MKKIIALSFGVLSLNTFSQNDIQVFNLKNISDNNINIQRQSIQSVQTFASNVQLKRNGAKPANKINTAKPVNKRIPLNNVVNRPLIQRRTVRRNANPQVQTQQPLPQLVNLINIPPQMNPPAQVLSNDDQVFAINVLENNVGNSFGNEQMQIQQAAIPIQAEQAKRFSDPLEGIGFNISIPKMERRVRSSSESSASLSTHYKLVHLKSKFLKVNRKMKGKLSFKKRLRLKVDNCFKW